MKLTHAIPMLSALALAACGGGGGGSSTPAPPPPPPPPPPTQGPAAPTITITVDKTSVDEGQSFTIDATGTTDPNGDTVTFSIQQTAGPTLTEVSGTADGIFTFLTERVTADTQVTFTLTASDGSLSADETITVTIADIVRSPLSTQWTSVLSQGQIGLDVNQIFAGGTARDGVFATDTAYVISENPQQSFENDLVFEVTFATDGTFTVGTGLQFAAVSGPDPDDYVYVFDDLNLDTSIEIIQYDFNTASLAIYQFNDDFGNTILETVRSLSAPAYNGPQPLACSIATGLIGNDRPVLLGLNEYPGILFGTENNGIRGVLNDGNPRSDPEDQSFGFNTLIALTVSDTFCGYTTSQLNTTGITELYGYNPTRQELVPISYPVTTNPTLGQAIPVSLPAPNMDLVDMKSGVGQAGQRFIAMLFSDGVHEGNHAIITLQFENGTVSQDTLSLPNGVPVELIVASIDARGTGTTSDFDDDLIVVVPETPYLYVFENTTGGAGTPVSFAPIAYFETGFDINNVTLLNATGSFGPELLTGSSDGTVTLYQNTEG